MTTVEKYLESGRRELHQRSLDAMGMTEEQLLGHATTSNPDPFVSRRVEAALNSAHQAEQDLHATLNAHFNEGNTQHISHRSVKAAAGAHFDALNTNTARPAETLWNDLHTPSAKTPPAPRPVKPSLAPEAHSARLAHLQTGFHEIDQRAFEHSGMTQEAYHTWQINHDQMHIGGMPAGTTASDVEKRGFAAGTEPAVAAKAEAARANARIAKQNFHDTVNAHYNEGSAQHISHGSARKAAFNHFEELQAGGAIDHAKPWSDLHTHSYANHTIDIAAREEQLRTMATDTHGFQQKTFNTLLEDDARHAILEKDTAKLVAGHEASVLSHAAGTHPITGTPPAPAPVAKAAAAAEKSWVQRIGGSSATISEGADIMNKGAMGFAKVAGIGAGALLGLHALSTMAENQKNGQNTTVTDYAELVSGVGLTVGSLLLHRGRGL